MNIIIPLEIEEGETRVAATPEMVKRYVKLGLNVKVQQGAGLASGFTDAAFIQAGAQIITNSGDLYSENDLILKVRRPHLEEAKAYKSGSYLVGLLEPFKDIAGLRSLAQTGLTSFTMELVPRISRAQALDVLSSQANIAGYRAVIDGAAAFRKCLPLMMTAAGTVPAAKVFVMGVGVAGLQAIATARRLGALVSATDVRPSTKEQVLSLGAKFIAVEDEEFKQAETQTGYAKEMSESYQKKQAELIKEHLVKQDIVITTALIPGRQAPRLITSEMIQHLQPGSIVVDLAVTQGGNCEGSRLNQDVITDNGVTLIGTSHVTKGGATASALYARNLFAFVDLLLTKDPLGFVPTFEDEILRTTLLTRDGLLVQERGEMKISS